MPLVFPISGRSAKIVGRTPRSAAGPLAGLPVDETDAGPGGPARTRGSASQFLRNSQNWKNERHLMVVTVPSRMARLYWEEMRLAPLFATVLLLSCNSGGITSKPPPQSPEPAAANAPEAAEAAGAETRVEMVNVRIHLDPSLILH